MQQPSITIDHFIDTILGGQTKAAQAFGVAPNAVGNWKRRGLPKSRRLDAHRILAKLGYEAVNPDDLTAPGAQ